jgi:drug/metabolite transporter (DMT)-like permease
MEVGYPYDALLFASISAIIFIYSLLYYYYNSSLSGMFVYLIYAVGMLFAMILGIFLTQMQDREGEGKSPF